MAQYQSEQELENLFVKQLISQGFQPVQLKDEEALKANLKAQLEKANDCTLSENEFKQVLGALGEGNIFKKAKRLRDRISVTRDDGDSVYLTLLFDEVEKNHFQVSQQITVQGRFENRYDVTILVNGLPLVQVELKRRGVELKEAFNQIKRYQKHSYNANHGLFNYIQLFVMSNGVNTQYFTNNSEMSAKQTFEWTDVENNRINQLFDFTRAFLTPSHLNAMLNKYIVLNDTLKILMVLRPYQFYAVEAILNQVKTSKRNGYIWHTTGSGKTLTSFKAAQLMTTLPEVDKVVFVVDRRDLDYQTALEFNAFSKGCVDSTDKTNVLFHQMIDKPIKNQKINNKRNTKLIVTTLQKLNNVVSKQRYLKEMEALKQKRIVFIFDECHRSQFGDTHKNITTFFEGAQLFGFTGTPIFVDNAVAKKSVKKVTKDLFHERLHAYVIVDAIRDHNVLQFAIEYVGQYKYKDNVQTDGIAKKSNNALDIKVEGIDTKELLASPVRIGKIVDYIIAHHNRKTHSRSFNAMLCVSGVPVLIEYYQQFQTKKEAGEHNLKIATIFSYEANEADDYDLEGETHIDIEAAAKHLNDDQDIRLHSRDKLEGFIGHYNQMFGTSYTTKDNDSFYDYYKNVAKRVKEREIDILLVVNMFLTGFDAPRLNTLYVDKNLKHHGLIQAFSRTNRLFDEKKSHGNIICFRNLKSAADEAFTLFSNKRPIEHIQTPSFHELMQDFSEAFSGLMAITPDIDAVDHLPDEEAQLLFVKHFRRLMQLKNMLSNFADFDMDDTAMSEQTFQDFTSKYIDLNRHIRETNTKEKVSILDDVDFELDLLHRDEVNVGYILHLLRELQGEDTEAAKAKKRNVIASIVSSNPDLAVKKDLIDKFMNEYLSGLPDDADLDDEFEFFWEKEKRLALEKIATEENLDCDKFQNLINRYELTEDMPLRDDFADTLQVKPTLLQRKKIVGRLNEKFKNFIDVFLSGF